MEQTDNSNHRSIRVEVEVRTEITIKETTKIVTDQITGQTAETEDNTDKAEVGLGMSKILGEVILWEMLEMMVGENIETVIEMTVMTEAATGLERGHFPEIMAIIELEVQAKVHPGQDPELA